MSSTLIRAGYDPLPDDYAFFLTLASGAQGSYIILLSPGGIATAGAGEMERGIRGQRDAFNDGTGQAQKWLVLERVSGDGLLTFAEGAYLLVDRQSRDVLQACGGLAAFILDTIALSDQRRSGGRAGTS